MPSFHADLPPHGCRVIKVQVAGADGEASAGPSAMWVSTLVPGAISLPGGRQRGAAQVAIQDAAGKPVEGARVSVRFSASLHETVSGETGADGLAKLQTTGSVTGELKVNVRVAHVTHPDFFYAGDHNAVTVLGDDFRVGGTFNNWMPQAMDFVDGEWRSPRIKLNQGEHRLKFANTSNWTGDDWGNAQGMSGTATLSTGGKPDVVFQIAHPGVYEIALHDRSHRYEIRELPLRTLCTAMFVAGTFSKWKPLPMAFDGHRWQLRGLELPAGEFALKFLSSENWTREDWGQHEGFSGTAETTTGGGGNIMFHVEEPGRYDLSFNDVSQHYLISRQEP